MIDRLKDVMRLSDGTRFSPQFIENRLKFSPYVKEAVVLGRTAPIHRHALHRHGRRGEVGGAERLSYTTYTDLSAKPEVYDLMQRAVDEVNGTPPAPPASKFVLLYKELDADDEELTRTRKVRRGVRGGALPRRRRRALRRRSGGPGRHDDPVPGRKDLAHPHDASSGSSI